MIIIKYPIQSKHAINVEFGPILFAKILRANARVAKVIKRMPNQRAPAKSVSFAKDKKKKDF